MNDVLLIGNAINNINNSTSWKELLEQIIELSGTKINITTDKPFPLLYEEIYLKTLKKNNIKEDKLKEQIADIISELKPNEIHEELIKMNVSNYITTNYDYGLQKVLLNEKSTETLKNEGSIKETKYSVFRHNIIDNKKFWHAHGEINLPNSITLGFEHYGGQLQQFRNYIVTGATYKSQKINKDSLYKKLKNNLVNLDSWIDFFYKDRVHIIGLQLGYFETDLWWLLTNRARFINEKGLKSSYQSQVIYYCPIKYKDVNKTAIMEANEIKVIFIEKEGIKFYKDVINRIINGI